jgi:hypothetical protein
MRHGNSTRKDIVGIVSKLDEHHDDQWGEPHWCDWNPGWGEPLAYCKGKNGHYYLMGSRYSYKVARVQKMTQYSSDRVECIDTWSNEECDWPTEAGELELISFKLAVDEHKPYRAGVGCVKDMQRNKCYTWEAQTSMAMYDKNNQRDQVLSQEDTIKLVEQISKDFGVKVPTVKFRAGDTSWAKGSWMVQFASTAKSTVIHEMAHIIDDARRNQLKMKLEDCRKLAGHGPQFIGLLMYMNNKYLGYEYSVMIEQADKWKVKYNDSMVFELQQKAA